MQISSHFNSALGVLAVAVVLAIGVAPGVSANSRLSVRTPAADDSLDLQRHDQADAVEDAQILAQQGLRLVEQRDYERAASVLDRSIRLAPDNLVARTAYATALRRLGRSEEASALLMDTMDRFPLAQEPVVAMGYHTRALGHLDESVRWFQRGAEMDDGWYNYIRLAVSYTDLGDLDQMTRATRGLSESPYGEALGRTLDHLYREQFEAALSEAETALRLGGDELWRSLAADLAILTRDYDRALVHYAELAPELLALDPQVIAANATEAIWLALVYTRTGEPDRAADLARKVLSVLELPSSGTELPLRKVYRAAAHVLLAQNESALTELHAAIDQGYRSVLFERIVRIEKFDLFLPLHTDAQFRQMLDEIKSDNARMLQLLREAPGPSAV